MGVLMRRALLFGVHIGAPDFWKLPYGARQEKPLRASLGLPAGPLADGAYVGILAFQGIVDLALLADHCASIGSLGWFLVKDFCLEDGHRYQLQTLITC